jgi:hypothetical protein
MVSALTALQHAKDVQAYCRAPGIGTYIPAARNSNKQEYSVTELSLLLSLAATDRLIPVSSQASQLQTPYASIATLKIIFGFRFLGGGGGAFKGKDKTVPLRRRRNIADSRHGSTHS